MTDPDTPAVLVLPPPMPDLGRPDAVWREDDVDPWPRQRAENRYERQLTGDDHA